MNEYLGLHRFKITTTAVPVLIHKSTKNAYPYSNALHNRCPTLRGAKQLPFTSYFFMLAVYTLSTYFLLHKSNRPTDETQTLKQFTDNYCISFPSHRSVE